MEYHKQAAEELEAIVDKLCVADVLALLAGICHDKAEHVECNWQDSHAAKWWTHAAGICENASSKVNV